MIWHITNELYLKEKQVKNMVTKQAMRGSEHKYYSAWEPEKERVNPVPAYFLSLECA